MAPRLALAACLLLALPLVAGVAQAASERTVDLQIKESGCPSGDHRFCYDPAEVTFEREESVVLRISNQGEVRHNLTFAPDTPETLAQHGHSQALVPGETIEIRIPWEDIAEAIEESEASTFHLACGFQGHEVLGEALTFTVEADPNEQPLAGWLAIGALAGAALVAGRRS